MNLFFHPEGGDWTARSYRVLGSVDSLDAAKVLIEASCQTGVWFLLERTHKPFWHRAKNGLPNTVNVDSEQYAKPHGLTDRVWRQNSPRLPCESYVACDIPDAEVDRKLFYPIGVSIETVTGVSRTVWREKSHDW